MYRKYIHKNVIIKLTFRTTSSLYKCVRPLTATCSRVKCQARITGYTTSSQLGALARRRRKEVSDRL